MVAEHITNLPVTGKDSGRRARTQLMILHSGETPLLPGYAISVTKNWLNLPTVEASTHVFAGPDTLVRSVNTYMAAWHASVANSISIGYEQTGYAAYSYAQWTTAHGRNQMDRLGREMALDAKLFGIPLRWLSTAEVRAALNGDTSIKGFCTHAQVDPVNRTDPGSNYPYGELMAVVKQYSGVKPAPAPKPTPKPVVKPKPVVVAKPANTFMAKVSKGDTLSSIAVQFGTTVSAILAVNKLANPNAITVGQVLNIPRTSKPAVPQYCWASANDSLSSIGQQFGVPWQTIANLNGIKAPYVIHPKQKLRLW